MLHTKQKNFKIIETKNQTGELITPSTFKLNSKHDSMSEFILAQEKVKQSGQPGSFNLRFWHKKLFFCGQLLKFENFHEFSPFKNDYQ